MEWKPIETAPKDGQLILGFDTKYRDQGKHAQAYGSVKCDDGDVYRVSPYEVICWIEDERSFLIQLNRDKFVRKVRDTSHWARSQGSWSATHWMPLPAPPE